MMQMMMRVLLYDETLTMYLPLPPAVSDKVQPPITGY